jgi:hypothetical protein
MHDYSALDARDIDAREVNARGPVPHATAGAAARAAKRAHTVACGGAFRDAVLSLARRRGVTVAELARSVLLIVPAGVVAAYPDPGEPAPDDRDTVLIRSGPAKGRPARRKPRLQVRLHPGEEPAMVRRALALALALERGDLAVSVAPPGEAEMTAREKNELGALRTVVAALSFEPLHGGIKSRADALHVLGFAPGAMPDGAAMRARFRRLAAVYHPDAEHGDTGRMAQLNAAMALLAAGA